MLRLYPARTAEELEHARILFLEDCGGGELPDLPGEHAPPRGRVILAEWDGQLAGCVALRPFDEEACAVERLYVRNVHRGRGIGRALVGWALDEARVMGYGSVRLDGIGELAFSTRER
ncbi:MAG TPA: GNAT family N-acetyltransferase [Polyangia bacterium]|jgi:carbonic anhydrase